MLNNISKKINKELQQEQYNDFFKSMLYEDIEFENFIDNKLLNLNENGVKYEMLKNEMPFLFIEDTVVDDELVTNLQAEIDYEDSFEKKPISDTDETTELQEPVDFDDDFSTQYASDADADTELNKEVDYDDNQTTPVDIDEFSNEAADILFEMGDILGALSLLDEDGYADLLDVDCPDEGDTIEQAEEADIEDSDDEDIYGTLVESVGESDEEMAEDIEDSDDVELEDSDLLEDYYSLFEGSDADEEDDSDDESEDEDDEEESDEGSDADEEDDSDDESEDEDDEEAVEEGCKKSESGMFLNDDFDFDFLNY